MYVLRRPSQQHPHTPSSSATVRSPSSFLVPPYDGIYAFALDPETAAKIASGQDGMSSSSPSKEGEGDRTAVVETGTKQTGRSKASNERVRKTENPTTHTDDTERHYAIVLDLPGYVSDGIDVSVEPDDNDAHDGAILTVSGKRSNRLFEATFQKRFRIRDSLFEMDRLEAVFEDGLLTLTLPKKTVVPRRVTSIRKANDDATASISLTETETHSAGPADVQETSAKSDSGSKSPPSSVEVETVADNEEDDAKAESE